MNKALFPYLIAGLLLGFSPCAASQNNQAQKPSFVKDTFQLPARGGLFIGRQQELEAMASFFGGKRKYPCAFEAITGVGGMGKTHLALQYAHACAERAQWVPHYDALVWLYAGAKLDSQFCKLAKAWCKKDCKTTEEAVAFVYMALQKKTRTLLVFDNAAENKAIANYLPPQHQNGLFDILITTRNGAFKRPLYGKPLYITLASFTKQEARTYAKKILNNKGYSHQAMDALWETVSGLPLALQHALQYVAKGGCTLAKYPTQFAIHERMLREQLQTGPVVTSVLLSVLTLRETHPIIEPFLVTAAYLAPEKVPIAAVFSLLGAKVTHQAKEQAVAVLDMYGFISLAEDGQTFDLHRLVQEVLSAWHRYKKGTAGHQALLHAWIAYFKQRLKYDEGDLEAIYSISPLIPHAYAIAEADVTGATIQRGQAELYHLIGKLFYLGIPQYDRAKQCYEKALKIFVQHYGADHPNTATTMVNLGFISSKLGDYASAKKYYEKALKIREQHYGADHPSIAITMGNVGIVHDYLGEHASAATYYEKALKIKQRYYGGTHPITAITMQNLGTALQSLGDYTEAKTYLEKALKIRAQHYGSTHPTTAMTIESLGNVLDDLGDYDSAKTYLERALKINAKHYGTDHPKTARTMGNLGCVFEGLGEYAKARECYQQHIKVYTRHYGAHHAETKRVKRNLAILEKEVASKSKQKQPKTALGGSLKNDDENQDNNEVFDID